MSGSTAEEQVQLLLSCIRNMEHNVPDFTKVAQELGISSKAAAYKRWNRLLKANGISLGGKPGPSILSNVSTTAASEPTKQSPRTTISGTKRKAKEMDQDDLETKDDEETAVIESKKSKKTK